MFLTSNLLNLPSFLLSFIYFLIYFSCLQIFITQFFEFLFPFVTHHCSITETVPSRDQIFAGDDSCSHTKKLYFFWKAFLRIRDLSSDVFSTFSLILGREKGDFIKLTYFCWSILHFFILQNPSLLSFNFFNSHLNIYRSKFRGFSQGKWLTMSRDCWSDKFCLSLTWSNSKMEALFK